MRWSARYDILSYVVECYQGLDADPDNGKQQRQFVWEEPSGDVVIGNSQAFGEHIVERFGVDLGKESNIHMRINEVMRQLGEIVRTFRQNGEQVGKTKTHGQAAKRRVVRHGDRRKS